MKDFYVHFDQIYEPDDWTFAMRPHLVRYFLKDNLHASIVVFIFAKNVLFLLLLDINGK